MTEDASLVEHLKRDYRQAPIPASDLKMLDYAVKLTATPWQVCEHDIKKLRSAGFGDSAILDINQITGYFNFVNRLADGLGVELESYWQENL